MRAPIRPVLAIALLTVIAAGLAGCGRKGALEAPTASAAPAPATTTADPATSPKTVRTPGATITPSKEPSILDAIL